MRSTNNAVVSTLEPIADGLDRVESSIGLGERLLNFLVLLFQSLETAAKYCAALPYIGTALLLLAKMLELFVINFKENDVVTKTLKSIATVAVMTLAIIGLVAAAPYLPFVFAGITLALRTWDLGVAIYKLATSTDENEKKALRGEMMEKALLISVSIVAIATLVLAGPIVGGAILLAVGAGMLAYKFGLIQKLMNKVFNHPFKGEEKTAVKPEPTFERPKQFNENTVKNVCNDSTETIFKIIDINIAKAKTAMVEKNASSNTVKVEQHKQEIIDANKVQKNEDQPMAEPEHRAVVSL